MNPNFKIEQEEVKLMYAKLIAPGTEGSVQPTKVCWFEGYIPTADCVEAGWVPLYGRCSFGVDPSF